MSVTVEAVPLPLVATYNGFTTVFVNPAFTVAIPAGSYSAVSVRAVYSTNDNYSSLAVFLGNDPYAAYNPHGIQFPYELIGTYDQTQAAAVLLAAINAGAGTTLAGYVHTPSSSPFNVLFNITELQFILTPSAGGSTVVAPPVGSSMNSGNNGCVTVAVTLQNAMGNPAPAPTGGQAFTLSTSLGNLSATALLIPAGSSTGMVQVCNPVQGSGNVTITPGAGPLSGTGAIVVPVTFAASYGGCGGGTPTAPGSLAMFDQVLVCDLSGGLVARPQHGQAYLLVPVWGPGNGATVTTSLSVPGATIDTTYTGGSLSFQPSTSPYRPAFAGYHPDNTAFYLEATEEAFGFWKVTFPTAGVYTVTLAGVGSLTVTVY